MSVGENANNSDPQNPFISAPDTAPPNGTPDSQKTPDSKAVDAKPESEAEKIEIAIQKLPPDVQADVERMVRMDPSLGPSLIGAEDNTEAITVAVRTGRNAAAGAAPEKNEITGVDPKFMQLAIGAFEVARNEAVQPDKQDNSPEIVDVDAPAYGLAPPPTPRETRREKTYADLPPFPSKPT